MSMDFVTGFPISTDWKDDSYNSILVIVDCFTKIVLYKLVKVTINIAWLTKVIIDVVVIHYSLLKSIIRD